MCQGGGGSIGIGEELCHWSVSICSPAFCLFVHIGYADNTNRDVQTRKHYLDVAKRLQIPARYDAIFGTDSGGSGASSTNEL